jgi:hypothetical protein
MAMVKRSSSRHEQKGLERVESGIRAAEQSGISSLQIKQLVNRVYADKKQDAEEGHVTRLNVETYSEKVLDIEREADEEQKHVVSPIGTYKQYEGKRSQRFSRPVSKIFLDHPELLQQYNALRDHRLSRFMSLAIITKIYHKKGNKNDGDEKLRPEETHPLDLNTRAWQKFLEEHKTSFTKMHDMRMHEGLSHLQATNSIFKEMDYTYKATNGKSVFDQIDKIPEQMGSVGKSKYTQDFKAKEWNPELKPRYFKHFKQSR